MYRNSFDKIKSDIKKYAYSSFEYIQYESVINYKVVTLSPELVLVCGYNAGADMNEVLWATNKLSTLLNAIENLENPLFITFVPDQWQDEMKVHGFKEYGVLREYWINDLDTITTTPIDCQILLPGECEQASIVTMSCKWQSREFHGESAQWISSWLNNRDPNANACKSDCTILCHRDGQKVVGVVCIALYKNTHKDTYTLWVRELCVASTYQNKGIGKKLLMDALAYGKEHGASHAFLMADDLNSAAKHLYLAVGFVANMQEVQIDLMRT